MIMRNNPLLNATESLTLTINDMDLMLEGCETLTQLEKDTIRSKFTADVVQLKNYFSESVKKIQTINSTRDLLQKEKTR